MESSDSDDDREYERKRNAERHANNHAPEKRKANLNEALSLALSDGFPADTECDIIVTEEELRKEEDALKSKEEKDAEMSKAEEKTREALSEIRSESKIEPENKHSSANDKGEEEIDSDDDMEAYRLQVQQSAKDTKSLDSLEGSVLERSKYIPLRLSYEERKSLRLVNASVNVSNYTTSVDTEAIKTKGKRKHKQLQNICAFLTGLICSTDYDKGQGVLEERNFEEYESTIQTVLEISRRYKITNPEKLRSEYGKLVMLMQDAVSTDLQPLLGINVHREVMTVHEFLSKRGGEQLLDDPRIQNATREILPLKGMSRAEIQADIKKKERAADAIARQYSTRSLSGDQIKHCLYSICDNNSFLNSNRLPIDKCLTLLKEHFNPDTLSSNEYSLAIAEGSNGARLSHSHEFQYNYVLQSLTLWRNIVDNMFRLWYLAEQDLLDASQVYELRNTGQGLQRVQQSPRVYRAMHEILYHTQRSLKTWVGSSVIHLGDNNVPNALTFIDKYTQVSRILGPLINTIENLDKACTESESLNRYMREYGGIEKATKDILHDFFRYAFDGSGGNNDFDAGSCIDGRLTSAWNWCSQLSTKPFYPLFRLTGFLSFDGEFDK